jgi:CRISPR-associated protein Cas2
MKETIRAMRILIMYDLPSVTNKELKIARHWHKFLISNGFIMHSESVYTRLAINKTVSKSIKILVRKNKPPNGIVSMLEITERQFVEMEYLVGSPQEEKVDTLERYLEL